MIVNISNNTSCITSKSNISIGTRNSNIIKNNNESSNWSCKVTLVAAVISTVTAV